MTSQPPRYDFTAAGDLSYALARMRAALEDLRAVRRREYARDLGDPAAEPAPYYLWVGRHRDAFEREYRRQMAELGALLERFEAVQRQLSLATGEALHAKLMFALGGSAS